MTETKTRKISKIMCECCGENKNASAFYPNYGSQYKNREKARFCKECCSNRIKEYNNFLNEKASLWMVLSELGIPFINKIYEDMEAQILSSKNKKKVEIVGFYIRNLLESTTIYGGFWDSDIGINEIIKKDIKEEVNGRMDLSKMEEIWGKFPDNEYVEAYEFLEKTFYEYTQDFQEMDANLTNRYRDLCKAEYRKRKADEKGDVAEIKQAQANLTDLLKLLKLNEFTSNQKSEMEKMIERKIWMIENTRPAECEDLQMYRDVSGFEKTWNEILRCVRNLVAGTREYPDIPKEER